MRARLLFAETVTIAPVATAVGNVVDPHRRTPRMADAGPAQVTLKAQVEFKGPSEVDGPGGAELSAVGTITFLRSDCEASGYEPAGGDRLVTTVFRDYSTPDGTELRLAANPGRLDRGRLVFAELELRHPARRVTA